MDQMVGNFFAKPLQGKKFMTFHDQILNAPGISASANAKECVGHKPNQPNSSLTP